VSRRGVGVIFGRRLGSGAWGSVYQLSTKRRKDVVIKTTECEREVETARRLLRNPHPDFVRVYAVARVSESDRDQWVIFRERADGDVDWRVAREIEIRLIVQGHNPWDVRDINCGWVRRNRKKVAVIRDIGAVGLR